MPKRNSEASRIQSIEVGAKILFALADIGRPATLTEIAAHTKTVPAKLHRYLASMSQSALVFQPKKAGLYALGAGAIQIGLSAIQQNDFCTVSAQHLKGIRDRLDVTCFSAVLGNHGPTVVEQALATNHVAIYIRVGSVLPIEASSTGWAFGAWLSDEQYRSICGYERRKASKSLRMRLAQVRRNGCAHIADEYVRGVSAVSVPVFERNEAICGVLTALGPTGFFDNSIRGPVATQLRSAADQIGRSLGVDGMKRRKR